MSASSAGSAMLARAVELGQRELVVVEMAGAARALVRQLAPLEPRVGVVGQLTPSVALNVCSAIWNRRSNSGALRCRSASRRSTTAVVKPTTFMCLTLAVDELKRRVTHRPLVAARRVRELGARALARSLSLMRS
jgi:hypothetical protein